MTKNLKKSGKAHDLAGRLGYIAVALMFALQVLVFLILRDSSYPQVHDNLDLFVPHYRMMRLNGAWFAHGVKLPVMHGLNRDLFILLFSYFFEFLLPYFSKNIE